MAQPDPVMVELDERDREVLAVLAEGRANPKHIREETGIGKGDLNTILVRLGRAGLVRQVTRGLYEITHDGREEVSDQLRIAASHVADALAALDAAGDATDDERVAEIVEKQREVAGDLNQTLNELAINAEVREETDG